MTTNELSRPYILFGLTYMKKNNYDRVRHYFEKVLVIHPDHYLIASALSVIEGESLM